MGSRRTPNYQRAGSRNYRSWKEWSVGDVLEAEYIKSFEDSYQKTCHEVRVISCSFEDTSAELAEGKILGLNSCGGLNHKIEEGGVSKGSLIQVTYQGEGEMTDGKFKGKAFHDVELDYDNDDAPEAPETETENEEDYDL